MMEKPMLHDITPRVPFTLRRCEKIQRSTDRAGDIGKTVKRHLFQF